MALEMRFFRTCRVRWLSSLTSAATPSSIAVLNASLFCSATGLKIPARRRQSSARGASS